MKLVEWCESQVSNEDYGLFEVDEEILMNLNESEVKESIIIGIFKGFEKYMSYLLCKVLQK